MVTSVVFIVMVTAVVDWTVVYRDMMDWFMINWLVMNWLVMHWLVVHWLVMNWSMVDWAVVGTVMMFWPMVVRFMTAVSSH